MRTAMPLLLRITVGSLIVGLSLIASLLTSTLSALLHPQWRRAALWLAALSCLLLVSGFLIWLNA